MIKYAVTVDSDGTESWTLDGGRVFHRENGPAYSHPGGHKAWWIQGKRHRVDGPAIEYADGTKEWHLNGEHLTE